MSTSASSPDAKKAALRRELEATREEFHALIRSVGRDGWGQPSKNPGWTNREIGQALFLSARTVETHVGNVLTKLDCRKRTEVAHKAERLGLISRH